MLYIAKFLEKDNCQNVIADFFLSFFVLISILLITRWAIPINVPDFFFSDSRYSHLIGKTLWHPFRQVKIKC